MLRTVTQPALTVEIHAYAVESRDIRTLFMSKETRDAVTKELQSRGKKVKKSTARGQQLHPEFVQDFVGTYETGFGNCDYQTRWRVLYAVEVVG